REPAHSALYTLSLHDALPIFVRYGSGVDAPWGLRQERSGPRGAEIEIDTPHGELTVQLSVTGHHNVLNALGALAASSVAVPEAEDRKSTRLNSSHVSISYAVF